MGREAKVVAPACLRKRRRLEKGEDTLFIQNSHFASTFHPEGQLQFK
jgi:hypothetical protein